MLQAEILKERLITQKQEPEAFLLRKIIKKGLEDGCKNATNNIQDKEE